MHVGHLGSQSRFGDVFVCMYMCRIHVYIRAHMHMRGSMQTYIHV